MLTKASGVGRPTLLISMILLLVVAAAITTYIYQSSGVEREHLIVSTTTSLYETGFLDVVKARFEAENPGINVSFISQGTGLAIQTAMRGDADMILVHDPARERSFLEGGYGVNRKILAFNFFVIVGPSEDPAGVKGLSPLEALRRVREAGERGRAVWISRGDDSGTHAKEEWLWRAVGYNVSALRLEGWYVEAGSGMTATLKMADEKRAYTLSDIGTYLMNYRRGNVELVVLVEAGRETLNVYSALLTDPRRPGFSHVNFKAAIKFLEFLVSERGQELFASYGRDLYGQALFRPYVTLLKENRDSETVRWIQEMAYFEGAECPQRYRYQADKLYASVAPST